LRSYIKYSDVFYVVLFGAVLALTGCSTPHKPAPVVDIYTKVPLHKRAKGTIDSASYTVKPGETLFSIAWRANTTVEDLARINQLAPPYLLKPGQTIHLSEKTAGSRKHKASSSNSNNRSGRTTKKVVGQGVEQSKKQAYGETVVGKKQPQLQTKQSPVFSTKIKRWIWPADGKVIEGFSTAITGNKGINIAGKRGSKIVAAADGKVVYAGDALRGYGKLVIINHNQDYLSAYAHNDKILVKEQQQVKAGDLIATMGSTDAERVMLHFEVRFRGKSVNPLKYLPKK
jgi:lipoprotein NlpD